MKVFNFKCLILVIVALSLTAVSSYKKGKTNLKGQSNMNNANKVNLENYDPTMFKKLSKVFGDVDIMDDMKRVPGFLDLGTRKNGKN